MRKKATALNAVAFFVDFPPLGPPSWYPVSACVRDGCCRRNHSSLPQRKSELDAELCCGGDWRHSGSFLLRIMPPSWHPLPACTPRLRCRRAILSCSSDEAASIPKSGPEIKNRCTQEGLNGEKLTSIRKFGLEIKNRCTKEGVNGEILASIRKSEPEIKNRCSYKNRRRNYSSLQLRKLESDAEDRCRYESSRRNHSSLQRRNLNRTRRIVAATATAGETILLRGNEIRIGRGSRCR